MLHANNNLNTCPRCGKTRIVTKVWEEVNPETGIKTKKSISVCPDEQCQEEVNKNLNNKKKDREKKETARLARLAKMKERFLEN
jgi:hypothetical protein